MKYTAIYLHKWVRYGQHYSVALMRRIEKSGDETIADMLEREGIEDNIQFLFVGHPQLEGEQESPFP